MRVVVLGASGFIGSHLVAALRARKVVRGRPIDQLCLADLRAVALSDGDEAVQGDIRDPAFLNQVFAKPVDAVFHFAATLTLDAEMDFARGLEVNVHALMRLLEACRAQFDAGGRAPSLMFASSISTFGGPLPDPVDDHVAQTPQTSYGTHKVIGERLIDDYARRGFIDGRVLRLPVVLTHPGAPSGLHERSVSDRIAALIREPLSGRDASCPLASDTRFPVASVQRVVDALLALHDVPADRFGATRAMNLPSLTVTPAQIADAVKRAGAAGGISWQPDAKVQAIVEGWPRAFSSERARQLGLAADADVDALVAAYLQGRERHG